MLSRLWVIPLIVILTINIGFTILNPILPNDLKLSNHNAFDVFSLSYYDASNESFSTDNISSSYQPSSTIERNQNNLSVNPGQVMESSDRVSSYLQILTFGVILLGMAIGLPNFVVAIISIPVFFIYILGLLYLFSSILSVIAGLFR